MKIWVFLASKSLKTSVLRERNIPGWRTVHLVLLFQTLAGLTEGGNVDGLF